MLLLLPFVLFASGAPGTGPRCHADPPEVMVGESTTIVCSCSSVSKWTASGGTITGNGVAVELDTSGSAENSILVTANCAGAAKPEQVLVAVGMPMAPPPQSRDLCSISFNHDKKRPTRVDNAAKACLDDVALQLEQNSDLRLVVVGLDSSSGPHATMIARKRAINAGDYLLERGIAANRIQFWTGKQREKMVKMVAVPAGANFDGEQLNLSPVKSQQKKAGAAPN